MNNFLSKAFIFAAGALIGSVVTWKVVKDKYAKIAQEEIDSVKEVFSKRAEKAEEEYKKVTANMDVNSMYPEGPYVFKNKPYVDTDLMSAVRDSYERRASMYASSHETKPEKEDEEEILEMDKPYVIPPEEFGELGYDIVSLTLYSDGVLTDEHDNVIEDVDEIVGKDSLNHFGEYEDDSVFVRNDALEVDYEILADVREYSDIYPGPKED